MKYGCLRESGTTFWTGPRVNGQAQMVDPPLDPPLDSLPVYVRGGTILPQQPVAQYTEQVPPGHTSDFRISRRLSWSALPG
jgi:alpha-glucosidase (family GH31 glycosyl hydrolase)